MLITNNCEEYLAEVRAFADKIGLRDQLEGRLEYLSQYANHSENHKTKCVLHRDLAPHSFSFAIVLRERIYDAHEYECDECGFTLTSEDGTQDGHECYNYENGQCAGKLRVVGVKKVHQAEKFWFNGGLIFHGPHDNGGDGGAPTFSVNLLPHDGWSIHT